MAIQKPEWFKMDPAKFLSDAQVDVMSTLELGACFRLMCRQWIDGFIPDDKHLLARLCRLDDSSMAQAWVTLVTFFPVVELGKRANRYMWIEREKVIADLERKSDEGTRAARKRWDETKKLNGTPIARPNGSPMPEVMQDQTRADQSKAEGHDASGMPLASKQPPGVPDSSSSEESTPHLPASQLAGRLLKIIGLPIMLGNLQAATAGIESVAESMKLTTPKAHDWLKEKACQAKNQGHAVNKFWFQDAKYNAIATDKGQDDYFQHRVLTDNPATRTLAAMEGD
jgi:uncharacterized protein YdaU (DUF1376 family)